MSTLRRISTSKGVTTYDIYTFLSEIRKRPILWDKSFPRQRAAVDSCWYDVCRVFVSYFDELKIEEQQAVDECLKKCWKCLMDNMMKAVRQRLDGDDQCRMYRFVRHFDFFLDNRGIKMEDIVTKKDLEEADLTEKRHYEKNGPPIANKTRVDYSNTNGLQPCFDDSSFNPMLLCEANTQDGEETYEYQQQFGYNSHIAVTENGRSNNEHNSRDPDQAFFDSLKPVLREMNETQKLDFKIETLKLLRKYQSV